MRKCLLMTAVLSAVLTVACSKEPEGRASVSYKMQFDAWIANRSLDTLPRTELGSYILNEEVGEGRQVGNGRDTMYVIADYTTKEINGRVASTTSEELSKILGTFDTTSFYGPRVKEMIKGKEYTGVMELAGRMNEGGRTEAIIPGWLMTRDIRGTREEYEQYSSGTEMIYDLKIYERIDNIRTWELDSLCSYLVNNFPGEVDPADTVGSAVNAYGFYYIRTGEPVSERSLLRDTTVYINYTCRLLNGKVVDTTVKDIAKDAGFYVGDGSSYGSVQINMKEDYKSITMGSSSSSAIRGFTYALSKMHPFEQGTAVFHSIWGYKGTGSGQRIPPFASLRFDLELVEKP